MSASQRAFDLLGGDHAIIERPLQASIAHDDPMPLGPYSIGLTHWQAGDGLLHDSRPYTIVCATGQAIAGHVESRACAEAIVAALNRAAP